MNDTYLTFPYEDKTMEMIFPTRIHAASIINRLRTKVKKYLKGLSNEIGSLEYIVDVGASSGIWTVPFALYYPEAKIFTIRELGKPTIELINKVYYLKYSRVSSSMIGEEISAKLGAEATLGGDEEAGSADELEGAIEVAIENILTENGRLNVDPITNSIIVTDVPSRFPLVDKIVAKLDVAPQQIMIEVEICCQI